MEQVEAVPARCFFLGKDGFLTGYGSVGKFRSSYGWELRKKPGDSCLAEEIVVVNFPPRNGESESEDKIAKSDIFCDVHKRFLKHSRKPT